MSLARSTIALFAVEHLIKIMGVPTEPVETPPPLSPPDPPLDPPPQPPQPPHPSKMYTHRDLEVLNHLENPIWVFDISGKSMYWGNRAALVLWSAPSLETLITRNYADDMSEAISLQLAGFLVRFKKGEQIREEVREEKIKEAFGRNMVIKLQSIYKEIYELTLLVIVPFAIITKSSVYRLSQFRQGRAQEIPWRALGDLHS
jgi:hypothetical protein